MMKVDTSTWALVALAFLTTSSASFNDGEALNFVREKLYELQRGVFNHEDPIAFSDFEFNHEYPLKGELNLTDSKVYGFSNVNLTRWMNVTNNDFALVANFPHLTLTGNYCMDLLRTIRIPWEPAEYVRHTGNGNYSHNFTNVRIQWNYRATEDLGRVRILAHNLAITFDTASLYADNYKIEDELMTDWETLSEQFTLDWPEIMEDNVIFAEELLTTDQNLVAGSYASRPLQTWITMFIEEGKEKFISFITSTE